VRPAYIYLAAPIVLRSTTLSACDRALRLVASLTVTAMVASACGEQEPQQGEAAELDAGADARPGTWTPPVAFNGDCTTAKWADVSDECWSCFCETCPDVTNACDGPCQEMMLCTEDKGCLVHDQAEMACELRCVLGECYDATAAVKTANFDSCLISSADTAAGEFRACEAVCGIPYPGDVCERYP